LSILDAGGAAISYGISDKEGDGVAVDERIDDLLFIEVDEGGDDGLGTEVIIFGAGRMSCDFAFLVFEVLRRRVAPIGMSGVGLGERLRAIGM